jgi:hypothetical protein
VLSSFEDMVLSHAPKFCSNTKHSYKVLRFEKYGALMGMNGDGWTLVDRCRWMERVGRTDDDERQIEQGRALDEITKRNKQ